MLPHKFCAFGKFQTPTWLSILSFELARAFLVCGCAMRWQCTSAVMQHYCPVLVVYQVVTWSELRFYTSFTLIKPAYIVECATRTAGFEYFSMVHILLREFKTCAHRAHTLRTPCAALRAPRAHPVLVCAHLRTPRAHRAHTCAHFSRGPLNTLPIPPA